MESPIVYPVVTLGGKEYTLKLTLGAIYRLEQQGIEITTLLREMQSWMPRRGEDGAVTEPGRVKVGVIIQLLVACMGPSSSGFTPEGIADLLDMSDLAPICIAVGQAVAVALAKIKPLADQVKLREPAAIAEQPPIQ
jgi:hypothetical protein